MRVTLEKRSATEIVIRSEVDAGRREAPITHINMIIGRALKIDMGVDIEFLKVGEPVTVTL